ncbi:riboflavin synthase subunit beta, partial [Flavobacteriaceae bacterium]|nr:riboflavin synthase subunit beta [Flavobacteriaceae bacterium]
SNLKGEQNIISINDENYQLDDSHSKSNKVVLYIIAILVFIFLFIIDFDLSIFSKK